VIASFIREVAYANFLESVTDSIVAGKSADLIVLDRDLFDIRPEEIARTRVLLTFFQGRPVYRDPSFRPR
jgi:predicted amidohydrolase YtcJ